MPVSGFDGAARVRPRAEDAPQWFATIFRLAFCHVMEIAGKPRLNGPEWLVLRQNLYITLRRGSGWSKSGRRGGAPGKRQDHTEGGKPPARTQRAPRGRAIEGVSDGCRSRITCEVKVRLAQQWLGHRRQGAPDPQQGNKIGNRNSNSSARRDNTTPVESKNSPHRSRRKSCSSP
jgi:hypothetical protein